MTRFGKLFVGLLVLVGIGFAAMLRFGEGGAASAPGPAPTPPPAGLVVGPSGLVVPVAGVRSEALADTFGDARGDGTRTHGAMDVMAPRGTLVVAADGGRVERIFESELGGHTVYVRSRDGRWIYYYAHLDGYASGLHEGQAVARGQPLGQVGSTGDASEDGPHLHFEVKAMAPGEPWHAGRTIDPYPLLARR